MSGAPVEPSAALAVDLRPAVERFARRTPLLPSAWLSERLHARVYLKCESLQVTGSFKVRGGLAELARLPETLRANGVVAASAGNHGLGLAYAARCLDVACTIAVPSGAPRVKVEGIRAQGARVERSPYPGYDDTAAWLEEQLAAWGGHPVHAFDDPGIVAGNGGTTALEILDQLPDPDVVVLPVGGGGLAGGAGLVLKDRRPRTQLVGVNSDASPGMWRSFRDGRAHLHVDSEPTVAEGLEGGVSERSFALVRRVLDRMETVPEAGVRAAVGLIARGDRLVVEGSAAAGVAELLARPDAYRGARVVVVLTGSNIDPERLRELLDA